jgi:hypothetical protein
MPDQIYIGNFAKGLKTDRLPFNIDNDAFPTMYNFYSWRGRAKRKRGTLLLGRLQRQIVSVAVPTNSWQKGPLVLVAGAANLITGFGLETSSNITPGSINFTVGVNTYTEPATPDGTLVGTPAGTGTINYATGDILINGGGAGPLTGSFSYYPGLPVMGLEDFSSSTSSSLYPLTLAFDTTYSYQINQSAVSTFFYSTSYYKGTNNPVIWSGQDYQQFWTTNYPNTTTSFSGSLWATNNKSGLHFVNATYLAGSGTAIIAFNFKSGGFNYTNLVIGDKVWFNEWGAGSTINGLVGTVTNVATASIGNYLITFDSAQTVAGTGIAQLLTNSITGQDGIRWYDGDPTSGTGIPTGTGLGWVNFSPPLTATTVSIDGTQPGLYYLVGALAILPFKDRLLFFSPYIQTSGGNAIQLQDMVLWSWNGTPYYTSIVPFGQTFDISAYYVDQTGKGGYLSAGISQPIITVNNNEDVLLIGFGGSGRKTRFVYTGNDLQPFLFFNINSELPSSATFSAVALDRGVVDIGQYGIAMTDQQSSQRVDLDIPDSVFQIQSLNNGMQRVNAIRDFFKEWIYFSYPVNNSKWKFPTQTFLFNYRDNTWGILYENFTTHGNYRAQNKRSWQTLPFQTWNQWREPWNSGSGSALFTQIIAGNPQGFVLIKGQGTGEAPSGTISAISNNSGSTQITSKNHCVNVNDYLYLQNAIGILSSTITGITQASQAVISTVNTFAVGQLVTISGVNGMTELNGNTYTIAAATGTTITINVDSTNFTAYTSGGTATLAFNGQIGRVISTIDANNFVIDIPFPTGSNYQGLGTYTRLSQPLLQTKQFPFYWNEGRQVRLAVQKYLMDFTANAQVTVNIYLSQNPDESFNDPFINVPPNSLVYSQVMFTCPESTNIGLTPANVNLQMPTAEGQYQIWHRFNTSLIGDSFQIGITLSDDQMRNLTYATSEITLHGMHLTVDRGPLLA